MRLGVRHDPDLALLAQVVLVYLGEGQGMTVHPTFFESGADMRGEYAAGRIDLFLDMPDGEWLREKCASGSAEESFADSFPGAWTRLFDFAVDSSPCSRPALIAHSKVAADLRFTLLQDTLEKLLGALTFSDLQWLRKEGGGGPRDAAAAARRLLKRKDLL